MGSGDGKEKKRKIYLDDIPREEAWGRLQKALTTAGKWKPLPGVWVGLEEALGRTTAEPVWASLSSPGYHASAMDGYAVRSADTAGAAETNPVRIALGQKGPARYVDTGDPLPVWADAVVMIEHAELIGEKSIEIRASVAPWTSVRAMGEDMVATELVLPANHLLTPADLGAVAGSGHSSLAVRRKPRVAVIPTGTELITVEEAEQNGLEPGDIIEYNSLVIAAQVSSWGGEPHRYDKVPDDRGQIREAVSKAARENDLVVVIAGSSAGSEDYTAEIIDEIGEVLVHGIAVKPGHPVVLGMVETGPTKGSVPVLGAPGYPVSCALTGELFIEPLLSTWLGRPGRRKPEIEAVVTRKVYSAAGAEEYVRVTLGEVGGRIVASPLQRGAGVIMSLVRADGIVTIPVLSEGIDAGENVQVSLYRDISEIRKTIVHIGSHDICLDLLAQYAAGRSARFTSSNVGSLGGLVALRRGETHVAGSHLLDPDTGDFNLSYIKQYLPDEDVVLITFVHREQGLIVAPGNPKHIHAFDDLVRDDVQYVNRQRGAGTRVLLDYYLDQSGLDKDDVSGYEREEYTHLAVAAAVQSGTADCGLGIAAAARALKLDFVPLAQERYELVTLKTFYESPILDPLLEVLQDPGFLRTVNGLPGYDTSETGKVREVKTGQ